MYLMRAPSGLVARDSAGVEELRKIPLGRMVSVTVKLPRNPAHHRKFFALLNTVWQASGDWGSVEDLLIELKIRLGITKNVVVRESGEIVKILGSINFASMDQRAFEDFYERALLALCEMAGGIESHALRDEVLNQLAVA